MWLAKLQHGPHGNEPRVEISLHFTTFQAMCYSDCVRTICVDMSGDGEHYILVKCTRRPKIGIEISVFRSFGKMLTFFDPCDKCNS